EMGIPPAVPLPLGDVRLDVAGPPAIVAVRVETDKCPDVVNPLSVGDVNLPAPARRAEADGSWCCHLNPLLFCYAPLFATPKRAHTAPRGVERRCGACGGGLILLLALFQFVSPSDKILVSPPQAGAVAGRLVVPLLCNLLDLLVRRIGVNAEF